MKIALVSPYSWDVPGGVNRHVEQLSRCLRERGHDVTVVAPGGKSGEGFHSVGGSFAVYANRSVANISFGPRVYARIRRFLERNRPDLVHLHEPLVPSVSMLALLASRSANLGTFHAAREGGSAGYRLAAPLLRRLAKRLHVRAAVSPAALDLVSRYFPGEYRILPNGVDTERFTPRGPTLPGLDPRRFRVVFVGRDEPRKGLQVLLEALPLVRREHPEVELLVVGAEARGGDVEGVRWLGRLESEAVPAAYRSARVMVAPALGWESFGIVLLEAMACGLAVVASDIAGYRSVLRDGVEGVLVPPGDAAALAEALGGLVEDEERREAMAAAGLARAAAFSWKKLVVEVEAAYEDAVRARGRGR
ncbi:MAG: glycosyltransferase family 4 protein [Actinobacteria bacterium]|nr:glycosyltransferase family 4 protein [Actinomycetota bacterium]